MRIITRRIAALVTIIVPFLFALPAAVAAQMDIDCPDTVVPGGIYRVTVSGDDIVSVTGTFSRGKVHLNPTGISGVFSGIIGIHITVSGEKPLVIVAATRDGRTKSVIVPVTVREEAFPAESLSVEGKFVTYDEPTRQRIRRENREMKAVIRKETPRRLWSEPFTIPCAGPITGSFGLTRYFNGERSFPHTGIDISANTGETVTAANDGKAALILDSYMGGLTLLIDHGQGLYTSYCHLSGVLVKVGDTVSRGEPVALVGTSGRVTGAHLHFGVFLNHHVVNPNDLLNRHFR